MSAERIIVVGAGAFGLAASQTLVHQGFRPLIVDPTGPTPHSSAASRDISKVVRSEYGDDLTYTRMAQQAMEGWLQWNEQWGTVYHNTGITRLFSDLSPGSFEKQSVETAALAGIELEMLDAAVIKQRLPMFDTERVRQGFFNPHGGYVEARRVLQHLRNDLRQAETAWYIGKTVAELVIVGGRCRGVILADGTRLEADHVLVAAGAWTGLLVPQVSQLAAATAQPIFHLHVENWNRYSPPQFSVVFPETETSGLYALPLHPAEKVVKVGLHTQGRTAHPLRTDRIVQEQEIAHFRRQMSRYAPELATSPIVYSRICLYHDTADFDFLIDRHPDIDGLTVACGGSGHGFKFTPVLGDLIASRVTDVCHPFARKFRWRAQSDAAANRKSQRPALEDL